MNHMFREPESCSTKRTIYFLFYFSFFARKISFSLDESSKKGFFVFQCEYLNRGVRQRLEIYMAVQAGIKKQNKKKLKSVDKNWGCDENTVKKQSYNKVATNSYVICYSFVLPFSLLIHVTYVGILLVPFSHILKLSFLG